MTDEWMTSRKTPAIVHIFISPTCIFSHLPSEECLNVAKIYYFIRVPTWRLVNLLQLQHRSHQRKTHYRQRRHIQGREHSQRGHNHAAHHDSNRTNTDFLSDVRHPNRIIVHFTHHSFEVLFTSTREEPFFTSIWNRP